MKFIKYLPLLAFVFIFASFAGVVRAESGSLNVSTEVDVDVDNDEDGEDDSDNDNRGKGSDEKDRDDDKDSDNDNEDGKRKNGFKGFFRGGDDDSSEDDVWSGIVGKVTAINGTALTVSSMTPWNKDSKTTVYTVNTANAEIEKEGMDNETISDIKVGDMIIVEGAVTGTTVAATEIHIGWFKAKWEKAKDSFVTSGDPVIGGTVTAVSGTTITTKNKSDVSYTIEAKDSKFMTKGSSEASTISDIEVGDNILVQGTINNASVTAKLIIDTSFKVDDNGNTSGDKGEHRGFFKRVGGFFKGWFTK